MTTSDSTHVLSYGGGINSVALLLLLLKAREPLDEVVFADTGGELPETYDYINRIRDYLRDYSVPFTTLTKRVSDSDLYDTSLRRKVIPSALWRWCTRDFKVAPIHEYYESKDVHVFQYLGIALDELHRMKHSGVTFVTNLYPLVDKRVSREGCIEIIKKAGLPVPIKSACFFCPFGTVDRWRYVYTQHPTLYRRAIALEEKSKHFPSQRLTDQAFRNKTEVSLRQLAQRFE